MISYSKLQPKGDRDTRHGAASRALVHLEA